MHTPPLVCRVKPHLVQSGACLLLLVSLVAVPALAADCPSSCSCLLPAKAKELGYWDYCGGKQTICGYDLQKNAKYCYLIPVTCPPSCSCYSLEEGKMKGYTLCGGTRTLCGYGPNQVPEYCHQPPVTEEPPTCPLTCLCLETKMALESGYEYCGGKQTNCGEDATGHPLSCFEKPVTPAPVPITCPASCSCYTLEDGKQKGYTLCGGTQTLCGYGANQAPMFCHEPPVTVTPATVQVPQKCSPSCSCYTQEEGTQLGYSLCGGKRILCGYGENQIPMYCYQPPSTTVTLPVVARETASPCFETYVGSGSLKTSSDGSLNCSVQITASDRHGALLLQQGTQVLDPTNHPVITLSIVRAASTGLPDIPPDEHFRYLGYAYHFLPEGARFDTPVVINISLSEDEWDTVKGEDLVIRGYNAQESLWENQPTTIHPEGRSVTANVYHFSIFALFSRQADTGSPDDTSITQSGNIQWIGIPAIPLEHASVAGLVVGMITIIGGAFLSDSGVFRRLQKSDLVRSFLKGEMAGMMSRVEVEKRKISPQVSGSEVSILTVREIAVIAGSAAVFALAFIIKYKIAVPWSTLLIFLLMGGIATIVHELSHRLFGRHYGYPSELQFWGLGAITMLITSWIFGTVFAQPSRTLMKGKADASDLQEVIVRVAGPLVNLLFAGISFLLIPLGGYLTVMGTAGFSMNLLTSVVALMPVKPMDGERIFRWNRLIWAVIWIPIFMIYCSFFIF